MNEAAGLGERDFDFAVFGGVFVGHADERAFVRSGAGHGHGDAHGGTVRAIDPRVIGDGEVEGDAVGEMIFQHAAVEGLA